MQTGMAIAASSGSGIRDKSSSVSFNRGMVFTLSKPSAGAVISVHVAVHVAYSQNEAVVRYVTSSQRAQYRHAPAPLQPTTVVDVRSDVLESTLSLRSTRCQRTAVDGGSLRCQTKLH